MNLRKGALIALLGFAGAFGVAASASADTCWQYNHPGREEINQRLDNQYRRISDEYREGDISAREANYLRSDDRMILSRERFDARFDRSHLTPAEYRALNQEENDVSYQIGR